MATGIQDPTASTQFIHYKAPPLPTALHSITTIEEDELYATSRDHAATLLKKLLHELDGWKFIMEKKNVKFFKKKSRNGCIYSITAITKIQADMIEVMEVLSAYETSSFCNLMRQLHKDKFMEGSLISDTPARGDPDETFSEKCCIKYLSFKPFSTLGRARDFCYVEYSAIRKALPKKKEDALQSRGRIGVQLMYSIERSDCPSYAKSHKIERGTLEPSGYIVYPTSQAGFVEVVFCWACNDQKQISRGHKKSILSITESLCRLEKVILTARMSAAGFAKPKNWVKNESRQSCYLCEQSFRTFRRRHHCRICGDITCSKCSEVTSVHLPVIGMSEVRVCIRCFKEKEQIRIAPKPIEYPTTTTTTTSNPNQYNTLTLNNLLRHTAHGDHDVHDIDDIDDVDDDLIESTKLPTIECPSDSDDELNNIFDDDLYAVAFAKKMRIVNAGEMEMESLKVQRKFAYSLDFDWGNPWPRAPIPSCESIRLQKLRALEILDTSREEEFDTIVEFAADAFECPFAAVGFIDQFRQWNKAVKGFSSKEVTRDSSLCAHTIMSAEIVQILDCRKDVRFRENPQVQGPPYICFYTAYPLVTSDGYIVGTVSVADTQPKDNVTHAQLLVLQKLANTAIAIMEGRNSCPKGSFATITSDTQSFSYNPRAPVESTLMSLLQICQQTNQEIQRTKAKYLHHSPA